MKRLVMLLMMLMAMGGTAEVSAQGFLKKLGKKVEEVAKRKIEQKVERTAEKTMDAVLEGDLPTNDNNDDDSRGNNNADAQGYDNGDATAQSGKQKVKTAEMSWNKFDFVSGDEIMFEDNQANEQLGEFPSQWDVLEGSAEIVSINGTNAIEIMNRGTIIPLMKDKHYLPELFTVEFDFFFHNSNGKSEQYSGDWVNAWFLIEFYDANDKRCFEGRIVPQTREWYDDFTSFKIGMDYEWNVSGENRRGESQEVELTTENWHRVSISFNKRAMKLYLDQTRLFNIPNMTAPASVRIRAYTDAEKCYFIKNFRLAKGAVPLYDRMMSDGKFITYGITFDVGKATIKPESMGEINRIVQLMNENPTLKFSVEGHTDSTGNATSNQTLSEQRSQAIVAKLVELGIAQDRLTAVGKGQNNPIADNNTDEGRAKNRRVEFVKQ
ncbi:MAG: OmpA family protein [Bacteroides sp.]|nr:OmpA family protein [Bacteroides sp.]